MSLTFGFFNAEMTDIDQYDRVYAAEEFAEYFSLFVANGVFPTPATQLQVVANSTPNMGVNVKEGFGWINGYYAKNDSPYSLALQAAHGSLNRMDAVVLRWDNASRSMQLAVKTGNPAASPIAPTLRRDVEVYELMLATITVAAGATNITQSAITDKRPDKSVCGWVTGAVQNIDTTNLFAQYNAEFHEWFSEVQAALEGDVATNLLNKINALSTSMKELDYIIPSDVASYNGLSPTTNRTMKELLLHIPHRVSKYVTEVITISSIFEKPYGTTTVDVMCFGGGGGGGGGNGSSQGGGGGGGYMKSASVTLPIESMKIPCTIGAGGEGGDVSANGIQGKTGGATSFGTYCTANGGSGGYGSSSTSAGQGGNGGSGGGGGGNATTNGSGGAAAYGGGGGGGGLSSGGTGTVGAVGGKGGTYGGGGGGGGRIGAWNSPAATAAAGGAKGTNGGAGGAGGTSNPVKAAVTGSAGVNTSSTSNEFVGTGTAGSAGANGTSAGTYGSAGPGGGGGGGGYGGNGGNGGKGGNGTQSGSSGSSGGSGGGGGGGGYGANGGNGCGTSLTYGGGGGGGGGYGCPGEAGDMSGGGGGGGYGANRYGSGGHGGCSSTANSGISGCIILRYTVTEIV